MALKVGIVGAGRRVREIYLPTLRALPDDFVVVAVAARRRASAEALAADHGVRAYPSIATLCAEAQPDLVVVAVSAAENGAAALEVLRQRRAALLETPLALDLRTAKRVAAEAVRSGRPVGVAEQKPFLPEERFKRALIDSGGLGSIGVVENGFRSLGYHGVAQLRRYLAAEALPVWVNSVRATTPIAAGSPVAEESWKLTTVRFSDGTVALHHMSSAFKKLPYRLGGALRIFGSHGSIVGSDIALLGERDAVSRFSIEAARQAQPDRLSLRLRDGREVVWTAPATAVPLSDDQMAVAEHLLAMRAAIVGNGRPLYRPHDALIDLEVLDASERSERGGGVPCFVAHHCDDVECRPLPALVSARLRTEGWARAATARLRRGA